MKTKHTSTFRNNRSVLTLGQGTWDMGDSPTHRKAEPEALRTDIALGMTLIDRAGRYGSGRPERLVGEAIQGKRDKVFLIRYLLHWQGKYIFEETVEAVLQLQQSFD